ncbi:MAG: protoporphyrinogen oxidase [bacterium]
MTVHSGSVRFRCGVPETEFQPMSRDVKTDIVIVGAGISGLATAYYLQNHGFDTRILEKGERTGGTIRTRTTDGFLVEEGPNSALDTTPLLHGLFEGTGADESLEYAGANAKNRYIVRNGRLNNLPMNPLAFLRSPLFSASAKLRLLKEPFVRPSDPRVDETVADFVRRRLGSEFLDYAINPFVAGVYAGDPERLSVSSSFPKLRELEQNYGSLIKGAVRGARARKKRGTASKQSARMFSFHGGMQEMIEAVTRVQADKVHTGVRIDAIRREPVGFAVETRFGGEATRFLTRVLVLAVPAHAYGGLPMHLDFPIRGDLGKIEYPPVAMVFFGYRRSPAKTPLDGFGFLVPKKERRNILGTIWNSSIFSGRAPDGGAALTTFIGGTRQPESVTLSDGRLVDSVRQDLLELMGIDEPPDVVSIKRWEKAIPQYGMEHGRIIGAIEAFERDCPGLFVTGNFRGGISVADCVIQSHATAERVTAELSRRHAETSNV